MSHRILKTAVYAAAMLLCLEPSFADETGLDELLYKSSEHLRLGQPDQALALLEEYRETYGDEREFLNNLAIAHLGNSQPEAALSILRKLIDDDPMFSIITHNLLEMELGAAGAKTAQVNPILFVQSVNSFSKGIPVPEPKAIPEELAAPADQVVDPARALLEDALRSVVQSWADAWSKKDFERYIGHYADSFEPDNGVALQTWKAQRAQRLSKPEEINVTISNMVVYTNSGAPRVQYDQGYQSASYSDETRKEMTFTQEDNRWKISSEKTIRTY